jgi:hypothetical protein
MKLNSTFPQPVWKIALKISAVGVSLVMATYGLIWLLLNTLQLFVEGLLP